MDCADQHHVCEDFKFPPMRADSQIRLLVLPPSNAAVDTYTYDIVDLQQSPKYEVLSYAWGMPCFGTNIQLDDQDVRVTKQLAETLRTMRRPGRERWLFVGTLCINNESQEERCEQIKLMKEVLRKAEGFVVPDERAGGLNMRRSLSNL